MNKKNKVIFGQPWGGLGDNLAYSNLPRLYNQDNKNFIYHTLTMSEIKKSGSSLGYKSICNKNY